jgi:hypothetical protein
LSTATSASLAIAVRVPVEFARDQEIAVVVGEAEELSVAPGDPLEDDPSDGVDVRFGSQGLPSWP